MRSYSFPVEIQMFAGFGRAVEVVSTTTNTEKLQRRAILKTAVHIVVSCTDRKRVAVPRNLRLQDLVGTTVELRAKRWLARLASNPTPTVMATDLYAGDHWSIALRLPRCAEVAGLRPRLWVTSAGYGLVPADAPLRPYSATFASGGPDAVATPGMRGTARDAQLATWWRCLAAAPGPMPGEPRTLAALAALDRKARILVVASADYLVAMAQDLAAGRDALADTDRLLIISSANKTGLRTLADNIVPTNARLQARLRGARHSLGVRIALAAVAEAPRHHLVPTAVRRQFADLAATCPPPPTFGRSPMMDEEVVQYIRRHLQQDPALTHTRLLRQCRNEGRACEQARFRGLFRKVQEAL